MENLLKTERLLISKLNIKDAVFIKELVNTPEWIKNIGERNVKSLEDANKYIINLTTNPDYHVWTVKQLSDGKYTGIITYLKKEYLDYPDIGFAFLPDFFGKGYAFEAAYKVIEILLKYNISNISAVTIPENNRSIQLLKRLNFKEIKTIFNNDEQLLYFLFSNE